MSSTVSEKSFLEVLAFDLKMPKMTQSEKVALQ
jgi:hypothetical protein